MVKVEATKENSSNMKQNISIHYKAESSKPIGLHQKTNGIIMKGTKSSPKKVKFKELLDNPVSI